MLTYILNASKQHYSLQKEDGTYRLKQSIEIDRIVLNNFFYHICLSLSLLLSVFFFSKFIQLYIYVLLVSYLRFNFHILPSLREIQGQLSIFALFVCILPSQFHLNCLNYYQQNRLHYFSHLCQHLEPETVCFSTETQLYFLFS